ncbi:TetR/AcrR family transcriptional regulator [Nocardia sp. NPDC056000]|uniref:TetR/AcrR family transcriptional regulator n=1 Tax=Nocardia sp. NPDC056000 TaxID=3345674 RepID=UPI0035E104B6
MTEAATRQTRSAVRLQPEQRRQQLLDSASALVIRSGFANATMQAIAREAGVTRPVVYEFYSDRAELLGDLLERETERALGSMLAAAPEVHRGTDIGELMRSALTGFLHIVMSDPQTWQLILLPPSGAPETVRAGMEATRAAIFAALRSSLEPLAEPFGSTESDSELMALAFLSGCESAARLVLKDPKQFPPERITAVVTWFIDRFAIGRPR